MSVIIKSKYFYTKEFECNCGCGQNEIEYELYCVLLDLRQHFGPIKITSGNRCMKHNKAIGGSRKSQHLLGKAADIVVVLYDATIVQDYLDFKYINKYGVGRYDTFTHIDVRSKKARWECTGY